MVMPTRIQLRRTKGWRKPPETVVVSRPTKWGNPFDWRVYRGSVEDPKLKATLAYFFWITGEHDYGEAMQERRQWILEHLPELRGKSLACWCGVREACHGDVLVVLANEESLPSS